MAKRTGTINRGTDGRVAPFLPTAEQRQLVQNLAGIGTTHQEIIACVPWNRPDCKPISGPTLRKHFREELDRGVAVANAKVKRSLFDMATGGNLGAAIFWLKARCGWKETVAVETTGKNGAPLAPAQTFVYLPAKDAPPEEQEWPDRASMPSAAPLALPEPPTEPSWHAPDADRPVARVVGSIEPLSEHTKSAFRINTGRNVR